MNMNRRSLLLSLVFLGAGLIIVGLCIVVSMLLKSSREQSERVLATAYERAFVSRVESLRRGSNEFATYGLADVDRNLARLRRIVRLEELLVEKLYVESYDVTDRGIEDAAAIVGLKEVMIVGGRIGNRAITCLSENSSIEDLVLVNTDVDDEGVRALQRMQNLRSLTLFRNREARVGEFREDAWIDAFGRLTQLAQLAIGGDWVTDEHVLEIAQALPECEVQKLEEQPY